MPKPTRIRFPASPNPADYGIKPVSRRRMHATDHRVAVLEAVATTITGKRDQVIDDAVSVSPSLSKDNAGTMLWQLRHEGLVGVNDEHSYFLTKTGLDWLTHGRFDRELPKFSHRQPKTRKKT